MFRLFLLISCITILLQPQGTNVTIRGTVLDNNSGLPVAGCTLYIKKLRTGTITDSLGTFAFLLPGGQHTLSLSHISYLSSNRVLTVPLPPAERPLVIRLTPATIQQKEVRVTVKRDVFANVQEMKSADMNRVPTAFNDVLRSVTILSGVISNNELSSGYSVRGGNHSENLIYLNGYEIYRPFLLRQGVEENQTLINPDMVDKLAFFNGSFPVSYGDKMSSALAVSYMGKMKEELSGSIRMNLLNGGVTLGRRIGGLSVLGGLRFAYPGFFVKKLQTNGGYHPAFADIQLLTSYTFADNTEIELFAIHGKNTFNITPTHWNGNFRDADGGGFASAVDIQYSGYREYAFSTGLYAAKIKKSLDRNNTLHIAYSHYRSNEDETGNVAGTYYYIPDAAHPDENVQYLKNRFETSNNHLRLSQNAVDLTLFSNYEEHNFRTGFSGKWRKVYDAVQETALDTGASSLIDSRVARNEVRAYHPDEMSMYIMDSYKPAVNGEINAGLRATYASLSRELLLSPRVQASWNIDINNKLFAGWGYYYQTPYYLEQRLNPVPVQSQRAIHYSLGWDNTFKPNLTFHVEAYYKALSRLIPYYTEGQKIIYTGSNGRQGYAYGLDAMVQGEVVEGIQSWLGYGYLSTKERPNGGGTYQRRLTDQTHSLLLFLQDRIKKHRNWQVHTRFLIGTGQLYLNRIITYDEQSKKYLMTVDLNNPQEYFLYMRADMGCSVEYPVYHENKIRFTAEVLNVFNTYNYAGYQFVQVFINIPRPVRIPEVLSSRFFNVQLEYNF